MFRMAVTWHTDLVARKSDGGNHHIAGDSGLIREE